MDNDLKDKIALRQSANYEIINRIVDMAESYPNLRFHQILSILGVSKTEPVVHGMSKFAHVQQADLFSEESVDTLDRIKNKDTDEKN